MKPFVVGMTAVMLVACNGQQGDSGAPSASVSVSPDTATATATTAASSTTSSAPESTAAPETSASSGATAAPKPGGAAQPGAQPGAQPTAKPSASVAAGKKYNCGGKGQKACPMQGWMKGVMARAMASGDGEKIAKALNTIAAKPVAGFGSWTGIAAAGAAKAAAGDIDGAKASCKKCHSLYQKKYVATMRDQPW